MTMVTSAGRPVTLGIVLGLLSPGAEDRERSRDGGLGREEAAVRG